MSSHPKRCLPLMDFPHFSVIPDISLRLAFFFFRFHHGQGGSVGSRVTAVTHMTTNSGSEVVAGGVDGRMIFLQTSNLQAAATVDENTGAIWMGWGGWWVEKLPDIFGFSAKFLVELSALREL